MSKPLTIDLNEALLQFTPAIWSGSDLNEAQAARLAEKLVKLLVQRCKVDVIEFEADAKEVSDELFVRGFRYGDKLQVFVLKPKKSEGKT